MGLSTALDISQNLEISLENAIGMHLQSNHYPPVPLSMVEPCIAALDAYYEEDYQKQIKLPEGVFWRGSESAPASAIIESHHLEAWLPEEEY